MTAATSTSRAVSLQTLFADGVSDVPDVQVTDITTHSSRVAAGGLFIACQGFAGHGLEYLDAALQRRPAAVAWEPAPGIAEPALPAGVHALEVDDLAAQVGDLADRFFGRPSAALRVTGITGTNGKTTAAWLAAQALQQLGHAAGYMGTLGYGLGQQLHTTTLTTPGCIAVHRRLRELSDAGAGYVVMEVSSHGLDQGRLDGVRVDTAALTNLSRDHLDYHGTMERYAAAKARLFQFDTLQSAVINVGDAFGASLVEQCAAVDEVLTAALVGQAPAEIVPALLGEVVALDAGGLKLRLTNARGSAELRSAMWGRFNAENLLIAAGILLVHDIPLEQAAAALAAVAAPAGRMQRLPSRPDQPAVIVDFAHTPDGLRNALTALREHTEGRISVVFGCGGERDAGKRPLMGAVASELADTVYVTDDNPRGEDPAAIRAMVAAGARTAVVDVPERREAIQRAIGAAHSGDVVLIAGKGSEAEQHFAEHSVPFSDAREAAAVLEARA